jgi:hypothetical protein
MTSVALIPGAGGLGWYWHLVEHDLQNRGYDVFAAGADPLGGICQRDDPAAGGDARRVVGQRRL